MKYIFVCLFKVIWAGIPLISFPQKKMASRVGASILHSIGLDELVVESYEAYEELAIRLAKDPTELKKFKEIVIKERTSSKLFNSKVWVENWEKGLQNVLMNETSSKEKFVYVTK